MVGVAIRQNTDIIATEVRMYQLPETCSVTDFRDNIASHLRKIRTARRPTMLTHNGKAAAVLMSPREFEAYAAARDVVDTARAVSGVRAAAAGGIRSGSTKRRPADSRSVSEQLLESLGSGRATRLTTRDFDRIRADLRSRSDGKRSRKAG